MRGDFMADDSREASALALDKADAAGAVVDTESVTRVLALSPAEQTELAQRFVEGERPRVVEALLRDPFGLSHGVLADCVATAWLDLQAKSDPQTARLHTAARERVEFLADRTQQMASALPALSPQQRRDAALASAMAGRA